MFGEDDSRKKIDVCDEVDAWFVQVWRETRENLLKSQGSEAARERVADAYDQLMRAALGAASRRSFDNQK